MVGGWVCGLRWVIGWLWVRRGGWVRGFVTVNENILLRNKKRSYVLLKAL